MLPEVVAFLAERYPGKKLSIDKIANRICVYEHVEIARVVCEITEQELLASTDTAMQTLINAVEKAWTPQPLPRHISIPMADFRKFLKSVQVGKKPDSITFCELAASREYVVIDSLKDEMTSYRRSSGKCIPIATVASQRHDGAHCKKAVVEVVDTLVAAVSEANRQARDKDAFQCIFLSDADGTIIRTYSDEFMGASQAWCDVLIIKGHWSFDVERGLYELEG
jgi:hypothetical protein